MCLLQTLNTITVNQSISDISPCDSESWYWDFQMVFCCLFCVHVCVVIISSLYKRYLITFLYPLPRKDKCSCMKKWSDNKWFWGRPYWPIDKYLFKMFLIFLFKFVHFISETFVRRLWFFVFRKLPRVNIRFFKILLGLLKTRFGTEGWHIFQHTFQKYVS